jgi:amino acid permease
MTSGRPKQIHSRAFFRTCAAFVIFFLTYGANNLIYESHCGLVEDCKLTFRENRNDEERNQEGCKEGRKKGPSQKEEVAESRSR